MLSFRRCCVAVLLSSLVVACGDNTAPAELESPPDDTTGPAIAIAFPRAGQASRARRVWVRGSVADPSGVANVAITSAGQTVIAELAADGTFAANVPLAAAGNILAISATDRLANTSQATHAVYFGQRLASGGGHGGAIADGRIYTWGRNNLGQTGLGFVSHENRTAYCERTLTAARDIALCKATTITLIDAVCRNPGFVTPTPADSPEAVACRAATRITRDAVCDAAADRAPPDCKTSSSVNLASLCDTAFGVGTPASNACEARLACDGAYAAGSPEHASCIAVAGAVPSVFPSPATPYAPVEITAPEIAGVTFTSLAFNQNSSAALDAAGQVWTWGDNGSGQLCRSDVLDRRVPNRVAAFGAAGTTAIALSRGYDHMLILRSDGSVWACGLNTVGQIGDGASGAPANRYAPVQVQGLPSNIVQVLGSAASSYALTASGQVWAWGGNQYGNLGNGTASTAAPIPALVPGLAEIVMIASGRDHVLAATRNGAVFGWGLNAANQVNASDDDVLSPVAIEGISDAHGVYANGNQGFYEDERGQLWGWGQNGSGNLGIPENGDMPAPSAPVFGIADVLDVAIGSTQGFARVDDQVFAWGWSFHGSLGAGASAIHTWPYRTPLRVQLPGPLTD